MEVIRGASRDRRSKRCETRARQTELHDHSIQEFDVRSHGYELILTLTEPSALEDAELVATVGKLLLSDISPDYSSELWKESGVSWFMCQTTAYFPAFPQGLMLKIEDGAYYN